MINEVVIGMSVPVNQNTLTKSIPNFTVRYSAVIEKINQFSSDGYAKFVFFTSTEALDAAEGGFSH
jgi:hypothetical protein